MICAGIDAGSRAIKVVLIDAETREVLAADLADQGIAQREDKERRRGDEGVDDDELASRNLIDGRLRFAGCRRLACIN